MIILHRVIPIVAALIAAAVFGVVWFAPASVYAAAAVALLLYWWLASSLPAQGVGERLQRWFILCLPLLAGGWLWVLLDQPSARQWMPIVTVGLVLATGEVLFQSAYRRIYPYRTWLAGAVVLSAWFICSSLALSNLLLNWTTLTISLVGGLAALYLLHVVVWIYELPVDPIWAQIAWFLIYAQLFFGILLMPVLYPTQAIAGLVAIAVGLRMRLGQRVQALSLRSPWAVALVGVIALVLLFLL